MNLQNPLGLPPANMTAFSAPDYISMCISKEINLESFLRATWLLLCFRYSFNTSAGQIVVDEGYPKYFYHVWGDFARGKTISASFTFRNKNTLVFVIGMSEQAPDPVSYLSTLKTWAEKITLNSQDYNRPKILDSKTPQVGFINKKNVLPFKTVGKLNIKDLHLRYMPRLQQK